MITKDNQKLHTHDKCNNKNALHHSFTKNLKAEILFQYVKMHYIEFQA